MTVWNRSNFFFQKCCLLKLSSERNDFIIIIISIYFCHKFIKKLQIVTDE